MGLKKVVQGVTDYYKPLLCFTNSLRKCYCIHQLDYLGKYYNYFFSHEFYVPVQ